VPAFHIEEEISLGTWGDILNRPGYQSPVETRNFRFLHIAAIYSFKEQSARYGISDCQRAHSRGFLFIRADQRAGKETQTDSQRSQLALTNVNHVS